jgi:hypothetical protein
MNIDRYLNIDELPQECIEDCSHSVQVDADVAYWVEKLDFNVNRDNAIKCLKGYGSWDQAELIAMDNSQLAGIVLWLACSDFHEHQNWQKSHPDLLPEDAPYGSTMFCLE